MEKRFTVLIREDCPIRSLDQVVTQFVSQTPIFLIWISKDAELTFSFRLQDAFQNVIFQQFDLACEEDFEERLWAAHHKIIKKYQQNISKVSLTFLAMAF